MISIRTKNVADLRARRRKLRRQSTPEEIALWKLIKGRQLGGFQWRRQFSVGPYIIDFYCPQAKLGVELDGRQHEMEEALQYDAARERYLASYGIEILRIENRAIWNCSDMVIATIEEKLNNRCK
ncbi:MAG: DUF559 domain-containing protein [Tidjanibacter sp.]|nr:DUF559 domain-containing protein [Tidjanibacter sp.]